MATVGGLVINLALNTAGLSTGLARAESQLAAFQMRVTGVSTKGAESFPILKAAAVTAGLAILGIGYASVEAAKTFEYQMRLIQTQANASKQELREMSAAVLALSANVATGPIELAKGLYHVESVGMRGAKALDILTISAQGAQVGNANLESVTNALVAAYMSGIAGAEDFSSAMGTLNGIVGTGNLRMEDLAASLSSGVLATAKTFGLSLMDVGAALADMADQGIPAEEAATRLRIAIALIGAPTKLAERELSKIGLTSRSLADEMRSERGLIGALRLLQNHLEGAGYDATEQAFLLKTAFGGSRSSAGILVLINSLELMDQKLAVIKAKAKSFPEDWAAAQQTSQVQFNKFHAAVEVLAVSIGNGLLPAANALVAVLRIVAEQTWLIVPAFMALTAWVTALAVKALVGLARTMLSTLAGFAAHVAATRLLSGAFNGLTPEIVRAGMAEESLAATTARVAAALAGTAPPMVEVAAASAALAAGTTAAAASTGELVSMLAYVAGPVAGLGTAMTASMTAAASAAAGVLPPLAEVNVAAQNLLNAQVAGWAASETAAQAYVAAQATYAEQMAVQVQAVSVAYSEGSAAIVAANNVAIASIAEVEAAMTAYTAATTAGALERTGAWGGLMGPVAAPVPIIPGTATNLGATLMGAENVAALEAADVAVKKTTSDAQKLWTSIGAVTAAEEQAAIAAGQLTMGLEGATQMGLGINEVVDAQVRLAAATERSAAAFAAATAAEVEGMLALDVAINAALASETALSGAVAGAGAAVAATQGAAWLAMGDAAVASGVGVGAMAAATTEAGAASAFAAVPVGQLALGLLNEAQAAEVATGAMGQLTLGLDRMIAAQGAAATFTTMATMPIAGQGAVAATGFMGKLVAKITALIPSGVQAMGLLGTAMSAAFQVAIIAGFALAGVWIGKMVYGVLGGVDFDKMKKDLGNQTADFVATASLTDLMNARDGVEKELNKVRSNLFVSNPLTGLFGVDPSGQIEETLGALDNAISMAGAQGGKWYTDAWGEQVYAPLNAKLIELFGTGLGGVLAAAGQAGSDAMLEYAKGLSEYANKPAEAFKEMVKLMAAELQPAALIAQQVAILLSPDLAAALNDKRPAVVAAAQATQDAAIKLFDDLTGLSWAAGRNAGNALADSIETTAHSRLGGGVTLTVPTVTTGGAAPLPSPGLTPAPGPAPSLPALPSPGTYDFSARAAEIDGLEKNRDAVNGYVDAVNAADPALQKLRDDALGTSNALKVTAADIVAAAGSASTAVVNLSSAITSSMASTQVSVSDAARALVDRFGNDLAGLAAIGQTAGADLMIGIRDGLESQQAGPRDAIANLHNMVTTGLSKTGEIAFLLAALAGQDIAAGLASSNPATYQAALTARKIITDQLDVLTNGAYSAGTNVGMNFINGIRKTFAGTPILDLIAPFLDKVAANMPVINTWDSGLSAAELAKGTAEYEKWLRTLDAKAKASPAADTIASKYEAAFEKIRKSALKMFDTIHDKNMKLAEDLKKSLQGPIDAATAALEKFQHQISAERSLRRETELRKAVTDAKTPAEQIAAQQALVDYLQDEEVTKQQDAIDSMQAAADQKVADAKAAEDKRYNDQVSSFEKELSALENSLRKHPAKWRAAQDAILKLLGEYGISYAKAGTLLGETFATKLFEAIQAAAKNLKLGPTAGVTLAEPKKPAVAASPPPPVVIPPPPATPMPSLPRGQHWPSASQPEVLQSGKWQLMTDQLAWLHAGEMVVPPDSAELVRSLVGRGRAQTPSGTPAQVGGYDDSSRPSVGGGGTIVIQLDGDVLTRVVDRRLAVREDLVVVRGIGGSQW